MSNNFLRNPKKDEKKAAEAEAQKVEESATEKKPVEPPSDKTPEAPEQAAPEASEKAASEQESAEPPKESEAKSEPDWKDQYARLLADFDNFKKRTARDREDTYRFAEHDILKDVLPTVDNLALALEHAKDKENEFVKGVQLVYDALVKSLKDHGAEPFDSVGQDLDTARMEAIATLPDDKVPEGKVSIESKRGWMLKDRVLRAAQVVVSSGKPA